MKSSRFAWTIRPPRRQRRRSDSPVGIRSLIKRIGPRRLATLGRDRILEIHRNQAGMNHQVSGVRRASSMISLRKLKIAGVILVVSLLGLSANSAQAQNAPAAQTDPAAAAPAADAPTKPAPADVPAYHAARPHDPLPETLDPKQFPDAETQNIYALAAKEKAVLYQQPCFCHCDREVGHESLLDCFVDTHASGCLLCKKEAVLAYDESKQGKTAAQIRQDIIDGKWKSVDLTKYDNEIVVTADAAEKPAAK